MMRVSGYAALTRPTGLGYAMRGPENDEDKNNGHAVIQRQLPLRRDPVLV
jgi:hypothetical protein